MKISIGCALFMVVNAVLVSSGAGCSPLDSFTIHTVCTDAYEYCYSKRLEVVPHVAVVGDVVNDIIQCVEQVSVLITASITQSEGTVSVLITLPCQVARSSKGKSVVDLIEGVHGVWCVLTHSIYTQVSTNCL